MASKSYWVISSCNCSLRNNSSDGVHTKQVLDQLWVRHQWFRMCVDGVSAVLDLSQCFKVAQQYITQPLGIHTRDLPLLGLLIFKPTGSKVILARQP